MILPNKYGENSLKKIIRSGPLKKIRLFQVNDIYFEFNDTKTLIIDGGILLQFPKGTINLS